MLFLIFKDTTFLSDNHYFCTDETICFYIFLVRVRAFARTGSESDAISGFHYGGIY